MGYNSSRMHRIQAVCAVFFLLLATVCQGQVETKIEQILKLQVYIAELEKGYSIVQKGLKVIGDIKAAHLSLDQDFFAALETVNPALKGFKKVADILVMRDEMMAECQQAVKIAGTSGDFTASELLYVRKVTTSLQDGCTDRVGQLNKILTFGTMKMSDDERLRNIDVCYEAMKERYEFIFSFVAELRFQSLLRKREKQGLGTLELLR